MTRKQSRKRHTCKIIRFPAVILTVEMVQIVQEALAGVSAWLAAAPRHYANLKFGAETVAGMQEKFRQMIAEDRIGLPVPLDQNEILLLHTSLLVFAYRLQGSTLMDNRSVVLICEEIRQMLPPLPFKLPNLQYN